MNETETSIIEALQQAIQTEMDGYHFFKMAAQSTGDERGREVFELLAEEELDHRRYLEQQVAHYKESGTFDSTIELKRRVDLSPDNPIFSDKLRQNAAKAHYEMSALSIGMELELRAQRFYESLAESSDDPAVSQFFKRLADWEGTHYEALAREQESLRHDYWDSAGFAPF